MAEMSEKFREIEKILAKFSSNWWSSIEGATSNAERSAVDSLKTLRDQVAHGAYNGTGFTTVEGYYVGAKRFVEAVSDELLT